MVKIKLSVKKFNECKFRKRILEGIDVEKCIKQAFRKENGMDAINCVVVKKAKITLTVDSEENILVILTCKKVKTYTKPIGWEELGKVVLRAVNFTDWDLIHQFEKTEQKETFATDKEVIDMLATLDEEAFDSLTAEIVDITTAIVQYAGTKGKSISKASMTAALHHYCNEAIENSFSEDWD